MKLTQLASNQGAGVIGLVDNTATKVVMTAMDAIGECKQEIVTGAIGIALIVAADNLLGNSEFIAQAIDGQFEITDVVEATKMAGMGITGIAAVTAAQKINKIYEGLAEVDTMDDNEFETYLSGRISKKKAGAKEVKALEVNV
ncbi:MAG: hypothetical protein ACRCTZ_07955 [Sarcina sp.]